MPLAFLAQNAERVPLQAFFAHAQEGGKARQAAAFVQATVAVGDPGAHGRRRFALGIGKARADAKIILKGIVNRIQTEEKLESNSTVWQKQAGSGSTVETLKLPSFEGPALPKLTAPGGYIADIPKGNLKTEIEKLAKQPEYAYLKQLQTVKDVNWNQVQLAYDKWDYKQEGLTGAGAAIIALAVAAVTGGVGAGLIGAAQGTASAAVADAAFTALVSQASISLINSGSMT